MKKIIKVSGIALFAATLFFNTSILIDSDNKSLSLNTVIEQAHAQQETGTKKKHLRTWTSCTKSVDCWQDGVNYPATTNGHKFTCPENENGEWSCETTFCDALQPSCP